MMTDILGPPDLSMWPTCGPRTTLWRTTALYHAFLPCIYLKLPKTKIILGLHNLTLWTLYNGNNWLLFLDIFFFKAETACLLPFTLITFINARLPINWRRRRDHNGWWRLRHVAASAKAATLRTKDNAITLLLQTLPRICHCTKTYYDTRMNLSSLRSLSIPWPSRHSDITFPFIMV